MVDYFSFEDVMHELEVSEEDLKRMVSEGELRAFRDENKMKFKRDDVEHLKKGRITEPTIILPSTPGGQDETVLDLDINAEAASLRAPEPAAKSRPAPPPPPPAAAEDDLLVTSPSDEGGLQNDETFIEEDSDTGLQTEPLRLADEADSQSETVPEGEVTEELASKPGRTRGVRRGARRSAAASPLTEQDEDSMEAARPHPAWTALLLVAAVFGIYSYAFGFDLLQMQSGRTDQPSVLTAGTTEFMVKKFWDDKQWVQKYVESRYPNNGQAKPGSWDVNQGNKPTPHRKYDGPTFREPDVPKLQDQQ